MSLSNEWFEGYDDGFNAGLFIGELETESKTRVAAFGAIRRAAEVARKNDCHCRGCPISHRAKLIRRAIRAAIGSPKA